MKDKLKNKDSVRLNNSYLAKGLEGVVVKETTISMVDGVNGVLIYRGYDVKELAEYSNFEEVAFLIYNGYLPTFEELTIFQKKLREYKYLDKKYIDFLQIISEAHDYMDILKIAVAYIGALENEKDDIFNISCRLVSIMPMILSYSYRIKNKLPIIEPSDKLTHIENFYYMFHGKLPEDDIKKALDISMILHAEQGINASTFSALVISSSMTDIYSAISGAIGCLKGYLHGGANRKVLDMLDEVGSVKNVSEYVENCIKNKKRVMGFGHRIYKTYDPRSIVLKKIATNLSKKYSSKYLDIAIKMEEEVVKRLGPKKIFPNVDFYSGIVYDMLGFPREVFTPLFAVARIVGWTAHIMEYRKDNRIFRPVAKYTGPENLKYVPIEERG